VFISAGIKPLFSFLVYPIAGSIPGMAETTLDEKDWRTLPGETV
jgi:hypothetical protein